jgi:hypothetical protein
MEIPTVIVSVVVAGFIALTLYFFGMSAQTSISMGAIYFLVFSCNMARAEIEELKLILDADAPGWRERNAIWTSTWDWNRALKRKTRTQKR